MDELERQLTELVQALADHRRREESLQHVALEMKGIELLTKIRQTCQKGKPDAELASVHPEVAAVLKKAMER